MCGREMLSTGELDQLRLGLSRCSIQLLLQGPAFGLYRLKNLRLRETPGRFNLRSLPLNLHGVSLPRRAASPSRRLLLEFP